MKIIRWSGVEPMGYVVRVGQPISWQAKRVMHEPIALSVQKAALLTPGDKSRKGRAKP